MSLDSYRKRQYSESQRRRCTQIIQVIVGDDSQPDGAYDNSLVEGISNIRRPSFITMDPVEPYTEPLRSPSISFHLSPPPKLSRSVTNYDGASVRSQSSIPGHLYASSISEGSRPRLSPRSISRSVNDTSMSASHRSSQYFSTGTDPPRQAKDGYEWVWFPEGYWAEREIVGFATMSKWARRAANESRASYESSQRSPGVPGTSRSESDAQWQHPGTGSPTDKSTNRSSKARPKMPRRTSGSTSSRLSVKDAVLGRLLVISPFRTPEGSSSEASESMYCKTMRVLGGEGCRRKVRRRSNFRTNIPILMICQRTDNESEATVQPATPTPTKETLNGTSNYFSHFTRKKNNNSAKSPEDETLSTKRKRLGLAPWHRKASDVSGAWSATSSIKELLMGKTPMHSPHLDKLQQKDEQYFQGRWHSDENGVWTNRWLITNSRRVSRC